MGCFRCFNSMDGEKDNKKEDRSVVPSRIDLSPSPLGVSRILRTKNDFGLRRITFCEKKKKRYCNNISVQTFTFKEVAEATQNFIPKCFIADGGFGHVYKGCLKSTGQVVAVKQLDKEGLQGNKEFLVEILMLILTHHPNLVNLIGYCGDGDQRLLLYEFQFYDSIDIIEPISFSFSTADLPPDMEPLDWNTRMKIAAGVANGLEYLHNKANPPVIYRDLKSSNILLDEGFHPKLSDFGLAKLGPVDEKSHIVTRVMGTYGYCAPEYLMTGQLTVKSDIYSFGVVLLELLTGRKAIDDDRPHRERNLVLWVRSTFSNRRSLSKLADPGLQGRYPMRGFYEALSLASMCIQEDSVTRPQAADVVTVLSYLASQAYDPDADSTNSTGGDKEEIKSLKRDDRDVRTSENNEIGKVKVADISQKFEKPKDTGRILNKNSSREREVAEAKIWVQSWKESSDGAV